MRNPTSLSFKILTLVIPLATLTLPGCKSAQQVQDGDSISQNADAYGGSSGGFFGALTKHAKDYAQEKALTHFKGVLLDPSTADAVCDELARRGIITGSLYANCQGRIQIGQKFAQGFVEGSAEDINDTREAIVSIGHDAISKIQDPQQLAVHVVEVTASSPESLQKAKEAYQSGRLKEVGQGFLSQIKDCFNQSKQKVSSDPNAAGKVGAHAAFMVFELAKAAKVAKAAGKLEVVETAGGVGASLSAITKAAADDICKDMGVPQISTEVF